jgi:hypothetical protein
VPVRSCGRETGGREEKVNKKRKNNKNGGTTFLEGRVEA